MGSVLNKARKLRYADLLGGLSIVADMGFGLPPGQAMRSCVIATALARRLQAPKTEVSDAFYTSLMMHVGCVSMSHETAALFGNEMKVTRAVAMTDLGDPDDYMKTLIPEASRGLPAASKDRLADALMKEAPDFARFYDTASGEVARATARRLGLPPSTARALGETGESWSGDGTPLGLAGEDIALSARIVRAAADAAFFDDMGGAEVAIDALKKRAGGTLDPAVVDAFLADPEAILGEVNSGEPRDLILEIEPTPVVETESTDLVQFATAFADVGDLKSPFMQGNSRRVARVARAAAEHMDFDDAALQNLTVAALLHDIGRVSVSDVLWEKRGPLTMAEWEQVRLHAYHTERILTISRALAPIARIAGMHHERLDGSGYHRGSTGADISMSTRVLAAADSFVAMTSDRPHRSALDEQAATDELLAEAKAGRLDPDAVAAVLSVAGHGRPPRPVHPAGLSAREIEVLRLIVQGLSNREISDHLSISPRTAEHHVQHIYTKIGLSTRPGAALFALQHGLLG